MSIDSLEQAVLNKLLDGSHPVLVALRRQLSAAEVKERKLTGVGFFTTFALDERVMSASVPSGGSPFGDVEASIAGLQHGAGFLLWLNAGRLRALEGYSYDEPWPDEIGEFSLRYSDPERRAVLAQLG